jgi:hypothetical protein
MLWNGEAFFSFTHDSSKVPRKASHNCYRCILACCLLIGLLKPYDLLILKLKD